MISTNSNPSSTTTSNIGVNYSVSARWNGGYNGAITITNQSATAVDAWTVVVASDDLTIANAWGMSATELEDGLVALNGADWGRTLGPWQSVTVGFTGRGTPPETLDIVSPDAGTVDDPLAASPFDAGDYGTALDLSMDFYYAQYSGDLPDDHPVSWRGDSALNDGADVGRDLSGGWYDAGDHVKFGLPMAFSATTLAWGAIDYGDGYKASGSFDDVEKHISWVTDYLMRAYDDKGTADLSDDVFYAQVGDGRLDHAYWGSAEDMTMARPSYAVTAQNPGTEVTAESAAALAAGAILLGQSGQHERADAMIASAEQLFAFSEAYQGSYNDSVPGITQFYKSWSGFADELAWAATWLYQATGDQLYLDKAQDYYQASGTYWSFGWDDKSMGTAVRLAEFTGDASYITDLRAHLGNWTSGLHHLEGTDTNDGLAWLDGWGSNRYAANTSFIALQFADVLDEMDEGVEADAARNFAADQIDYLLGDNPDAFSFVVGFGEDSPENPHHRGASGTTHVGSAGPNEHTLYGALVGGPDRDGSYEDVRTDYIANEVAVDYNAAFSGALAGLISQLETDAIL